MTDFRFAESVYAPGQFLSNRPQDDDGRGPARGSGERNHPPGEPVAFRDGGGGRRSGERNDPPGRPVAFGAFGGGRVDLTVGRWRWLLCETLLRS
jgi:hypothetical protein